MTDLKHISNSRLLQELSNRKEAGIISPKMLSQFTTSELEAELLQRQKCQFQRLHCSNQAQVYLIKPQQPACFNCQQDVLILSKDHD